MCGAADLKDGQMIFLRLLGAAVFPRTGLKRSERKEEGNCCGGFSYLFENFIAVKESFLSRGIASWAGIWYNVWRLVEVDGGFEIVGARWLDEIVLR